MKFANRFLIFRFFSHRPQSTGHRPQAQEGDQRSDQRIRGCEVITYHVPTYRYWVTGTAVDYAEYQRYQGGFMISTRFAYLRTCQYHAPESYPIMCDSRFSCSYILVSYIAPEYDSDIFLLHFAVNNFKLQVLVF